MHSLDFGKVAVLMGGRSAERKISLESGTAVLQALRLKDIDAYSFDPANEPMDELLRQGFKHAYIALHGRLGEDGTVQGALELMGLPYTGSGVMASALAIDKWRTKLLWQATGITSPRYMLLTTKSDWSAIVKELGLPLIVKPSHEGSTIGLTRVTNKNDLVSAYQLAVKYDSVVLAEEFIFGTELTVAILGETPLPLVRIEVTGKLYDYQAKYFSDDTRYYCPSGLPKDQELVIQTQALRAYQVLGCKGWGRVDLILSKSGKLYFLEANTSPGMTNHSLVPMAAKVAGISFGDLVMQILDQSNVE